MGRNILYKMLRKAIIDAGLTPCGLADRIGVNRQTMLNKINGNRKWLLWECIAIKRELKSDLPLEELFKE
jgi:DNA-binding XRE family transcriptional regulator